MAFIDHSPALFFWQVLSARYGEFFIAQLIESQDEGNKALVAEVEGCAIALISLSSEIDVDTLQVCSM